MKFHENILNCFQVIEWTQNDHCQTSKRNNSKNIDKSYGSYDVHVVWWCFICLWSFMKIFWTVFTQNYLVEFQREITTKMYRQELRFLCCAHRLMMLHISMKFHENILKGFQVIERTWNDHCQISKEKNYKTKDKSYRSCVVHVIWWCFMFQRSSMKISWQVFKL